MNVCPVCHIPESKLVNEDPANDRSRYHCERCGDYDIVRSAISMFGDYSVEDITKIPLALRKRQRREKFPVVDSKWVKNTIQNTDIPRPEEQADLLLLWIADQVGADHGKLIGLPPVTIEGVIGALSRASGNQVVGYLSDNKFLRMTRNREFSILMDGWRRIEEIKRGTVASRVAFMAMEYGDPELDAIVREHFKPAVEATGFDLKRLDDDPKAGIMDNHLRVEILNSRFLIADLTHANNGAYWEAGFAEGLHKPVVYTCKNSVFHDPEQRTHFDVNHSMVVIWDPDKIDKSVQELKDVIRATLPGDAIMADE